MNHLTSYQHAHDADGERAADREDAVTAAGERIAADPAKLREVIEAMLVDTEIDVPELLALMFWSEEACALEAKAEDYRLRTVLRDVRSAIIVAIDKAAEHEILMQETERDRERLNRDWED